MKGTLSINNFLKICIHIATVNKLYDGILYPLLFKIGKKAMSYNAYKKRAIKKNLDFELTKDEYNLLVYNKICYICKQEYAECGIDRVDNSEGYTLDNVSSCCYTCNIMKKDNDIANLLFQCKVIAENSKNILAKFNTSDDIAEDIMQPQNRIKQKPFRAKLLKEKRDNDREKWKDPVFLENKKKERLELRMLKKCTNSK